LIDGSGSPPTGVGTHRQYGSEGVVVAAAACMLSLVALVPFNFIEGMRFVPGALAIVVILLAARNRWQTRAPLRKSELVAVAIVTVSVVLAIINGAMGDKPGPSVLRVLYYSATGEVVCLALWMSGLHRQAAGRIVLAGVLSCAAVAAVAVVEGIFGYNPYRDVVFNYYNRLVLQFSDIAVGRAIGSIGNPNPLGTYLAMFLPLILWRLVGVDRYARVLWALTAAIVAGGVIFTFSRGAWLACSCGVSAWLVARGRGKLAVPVLLLVVSGVVAAVVYDKVYNPYDEFVLGWEEDHRVQSYLVTLGVLWSDPLLGTGTGSFQDYPYSSARRNNSPDNMYLLMLAETGVLGTLLWLTFMVATVKAGDRGRWSDVFVDRWGMMSSILVAYTSMWTWDVLRFPVTRICFWTLLGLWPCLSRPDTLRPGEGKSGMSPDRNIADTSLIWIVVLLYPLHLWHWPRFLLPEVFGIHLSSPARSAVMIGTIALAWTAYTQIEQRYRSRGSRSSRSSALIALLAMLWFIGYVTHWTDAIGARRHSALLEQISVAKGDMGYGSTTLVNGEIAGQRVLQGQVADEVLFVGDGIMGMYFPRVEQIYGQTPPPHYSARFVARNHCQPVPGFAVITTPEDVSCEEYYRAAMALAAEPRIRKVVLAGNWIDLSDEGELGNQGRRLARDISSLRRLGKDVVIISTHPRGGMFDPVVIYNRVVLTRAATIEDEFVGRAIVEEWDADKKHALELVAKESGASLVDPFDYLCPGGHCPTIIGGHPLYTSSGYIRATAVRERAVFLDEIANSH
jgi:O-antigen ligase